MQKVNISFIRNITAFTILNVLWILMLAVQMI
jgi:hypothetical protein